MKKIILASSSPRRRELFESVGFRFEIVSSDIDEKSSEIKPDKYAADIARQKAECVAGKIKDGIIISADTVVFHNSKIIGKVKTKEKAFATLRELAGKTHYIYTGVCIKDMYQNKTVAFVGRSSITFKELTDDEIRWYIDGEKDLFNLAGAYATQNAASIFVKKAGGDRNNTIGMPISKVYDKLRGLGYSIEELCCTK